MKALFCGKAISEQKMKGKEKDSRQDTHEIY